MYFFFAYNSYDRLFCVLFRRSTSWTRFASVLARDAPRPPSPARFFSVMSLPLIAVCFSRAISLLVAFSVASVIWRFPDVVPCPFAHISDARAGNSANVYRARRRPLLIIYRTPDPARRFDVDRQRTGERRRAGRGAGDGNWTVFLFLFLSPKRAGIRYKGRTADIGFYFPTVTLRAAVCGLPS